jgi:hypothetical protein
MASNLDAINVYPVPDGDTGANMSSTLREAVEHATLAGDGPTVAEMLAALARGALYGARGNSGVILSQALKGFALGVQNPERFDAAALASGLSTAATSAYAAVSKPVEGTMLTVLRAAGAAARDAVALLENEGAGVPCAGVLAMVISIAEQTEAATMEQLPALKEAGVPDAGGEGICVILRGLLAAISGKAAPTSAIAHPPIAMLPEHATDTLGHCTEFLIEPAGAPLNLEELRALASAGGNTSVVVVGDEQAARVHAHSAEPEALLAAAARLGRVFRAKIENMDAQHRLYRESGSGAGAQVAVIALSRGAGFDAIFKSLGAAISDLGTIEKPPAGDIAAAADALGVLDVIVLPNHRNVVMAAKLAAGLARCTLHVVPTESLPQGIAAAMAFNPTDSVAANVAGMAKAREGVHTVEVTTAAAGRTADGITVAKGQAIALVDGRLVAAADAPMEALLTGMAKAHADAASLVTIYGGNDIGPAELERIREAVAAAMPGVEVEALTGGQPLYSLIASVEA